jgi:4,5-dihydroxyphthalate decarboxylase
MKLVVGRDDLAAAALGAARETGADVERQDVRPVHRASRGFVNDAAVDVCELAVVTLLQAVAHGRPVVLLPVTTLGRAQHQTLVTCGGDLSVKDVEGHRVGVRSWSQTTGVWVRGFLTEQYGVDLRAIDWTVYEDGHVDGHRDPAWVRRAPEGARLQADFLDGRLDFGIMGNELPADDRIRTAIADAREVAAEWSARKGFVPLNHVVGVTEEAAAEHSAAVVAMYDAMRAVAAAGRPEGAVDPHPVGFEALRGPVSLAAAYALEQEVLPRPVDFDELVERSCVALGVTPARLGG